MPVWLMYLLEVLLLSVVVIFIYYTLRQKVFSRVKVNKWIILLCAILSLIIPSVIVSFTRFTGTAYTIISIVQSAVFAIFFFWFLDISGFAPRNFGQKSRGKSVVIRPKAKPNRVKNNKKK